mgnify:CR=1 FL=1
MAKQEIFIRKAVYINENGILGAGGIAVQMAKTVAGMKDVENYAVAAEALNGRRPLPRNTVFQGLWLL